MKYVELVLALNKLQVVGVIVKRRNGWMQTERKSQLLKKLFFFTKPSVIRHSGLELCVVNDAEKSNLVKKQTARVRKKKKKC